MKSESYVAVPRRREGFPEQEVHSGDVLPDVSSIFALERHRREVERKNDRCENEKAEIEKDDSVFDTFKVLRMIFSNNRYFLIFLCTYAINAPSCKVIRCGDFFREKCLNIAYFWGFSKIK